MSKKPCNNFRLKAIALINAVDEQCSGKDRVTLTTDFLVNAYCLGVDDTLAISSRWLSAEAYDSIRLLKHKAHKQES